MAGWTTAPPDGNTYSSGKIFQGARTENAPSGRYNCISGVNLSYRGSSATADNTPCGTLTGNFVVDWYFYDPEGSGTASQDDRDSIALVLYPSSSADATKDMVTWNASATFVKTWTCAIRLGAWSTTRDDYYQYCYEGSTGRDYGTWHDTPVKRSMSASLPGSPEVNALWHHGRILVGPQKTNLHNDVTLYIDNFGNAGGEL